jgi:selenide,water dikinase
LEKLPKADDANLLVGFDSADDAAVYRLSDELAAVQTLDFFPPMVDDPYVFGQIAAANALSDIYAMGGEVRSALNIVCFPETMDLNILGQILLGGSEKIREAGGVLAGGHSIVDKDVKYGLSVMGTVHPAKIRRNNTCQAGDALLLTKPLGVGIVCGARQTGVCSDEAMGAALRSMTTLNKYASRVLAGFDVHACTDVTGFGLLGHLCEMLGRDFGAELDALHIPFIPQAAHYAKSFLLTAAAQRNREHVGERAEFRRIPFAMEEILFDPQTSGGLLASLPKREATSALDAIRELGLPCGIIGSVTQGAGKIIVR